MQQAQPLQLRSWWHTSHAGRSSMFARTSVLMEARSNRPTAKQLRQQQAGGVGEMSSSAFKRISLSRSRTAETAAHTAVLPLQGSKRALILWDVENVPPFSPSSTTPVQLLRITSALARGGCTDVRMHAAANPRTWARLQESGLLALLRACEVDVQPVSGFADSADVHLIGLGHSYVTEHWSSQAAAGLSASIQANAVMEQPSTTDALSADAAPGQQPVVLQVAGPDAGISDVPDSSRDVPQLLNDHRQEVASKPCLVVISQDTRFAGLLAYARDRGVHTISVAPCKPSRFPGPSLSRPQRMELSALAAAAHVAVVWDPVLAACTPEELTHLHQCQAAAWTASASTAVEEQAPTDLPSPEQGAGAAGGRGTAATLAAAAAARMRPLGRGSSQLYRWHDQPAFTMDALLDPEGLATGNCTSGTTAFQQGTTPRTGDGRVCTDGRDERTQGSAAVPLCPGAITQVWVNPRYPC